MTTAVKICGIRNEEVLDVAIAAGADLVGFVHFEKSPRHLEIEEAARLVARVRASSQSVSPVVLLVDPDDALAKRVAREIAPDFIQLHGRESPERVAEIKALTGLPIIKAVSVATAEDVSEALAYRGEGRCADLLLFDAKPLPGSPLPGGNGLVFDWHILAAAGHKEPFALAGGLTPDNVAEAIRLTGAPIVDVSSGVEVGPGVKDAGLIRRFLRAAKGAKQSGNAAVARGA